MGSWIRNGWKQTGCDSISVIDSWSPWWSIQFTEVGIGVCLWPLGKLHNKLTGPKTSMVLPITWWCHDMERLSTLLALCEGNLLVINEFPNKWPVTQSFDVFFVGLNNLLNKLSNCMWLVSQSCDIHTVTTNSLAQNMHGAVNHWIYSMSFSWKEILEFFVIVIVAPNNWELNRSLIAVWYLNSEAWKQWPTFCRQHCQTEYPDSNVFILIKIPQKFVPWGPSDNTSALVDSSSPSDAHMHQWIGSALI